MFRTALLTAALISIADGAAAVPPGGVSWTAAATCEFRALAALHADPKLRNKDVFAGKFCEPVLLPREYEAARDVIDGNPETYAGFFYVNARTRHIDARLERAAAVGIAQVVVLGAGFDSRAYRFHKRYPKLAFFEVDLPGTIAAKQQAVRRLFGELPRHVRYVPIDFDAQPLDGVLAAAGYDPARKTFFILEGLTMYVTEAGDGATLQFIATHAPSGSRVVYDYILRRVAEGDYDGLYAAASQAKGVAHAGEPFVTGWTVPAASQFARRHGLKVIADLDAPTLMRRYLKGSGGKTDGRIPEWYRIVDAVVP